MKLVPSSRAAHFHEDLLLTFGDDKGTPGETASLTIRREDAVKLAERLQMILARSTPKEAGSR